MPYVTQEEMVRGVKGDLQRKVFMIRVLGYSDERAESVVNRLRTEERSLTHEPSGAQCLVAHGVGKYAQPQCEICKHCGEHVRPKRMGDPCPAREAGDGCDVPVVVDGGVS